MKLWKSRGRYYYIFITQLLAITYLTNVALIKIIILAKKISKRKLY